MSKGLQRAHVDVIRITQRHRNGDCDVGGARRENVSLPRSSRRPDPSSDCLVSDQLSCNNATYPSVFIPSRLNWTPLAQKGLRRRGVQMPAREWPAPTATCRVFGEWSCGALCGIGRALYRGDARQDRNADSLCAGASECICALRIGR